MAQNNLHCSEKRLAVAEEASEYAIRGRRPETPRSLTITSGTPRGSRDVHNDGNHCDKKEESDRHAKGRERERRRTTTWTREAKLRVLPKSLDGIRQPSARPWLLLYGRIYISRKVGIVPTLKRVLILRTA